MLKYIFTRHWDYWYRVYRIGEFKDIDLNAVEFHISDQADRETEFFHFDFYTLSALAKMVEDNDYIDRDSPDYSIFIEKYDALKAGKIEFFIGSLYYPHFYPDLVACNNALIECENITDFKSPSYKPHYAVIFISEEHPLMPDLLIEWAKKVCNALFREQFDFQIAEIPTFEQTLASYKDDGRF